MRTALAVELVDELADGKSAALPLIRGYLDLSYGQVGMLASAPLLLGSIMELSLGILAGHGRRRSRAVLIGASAFVLTLIGAAAARSFASLLAASVLFFRCGAARRRLRHAAVRPRLAPGGPGDRAAAAARRPAAIRPVPGGT